MTGFSRLREALALGVSTAALLMAAPVLAQATPPAAAPAAPAESNTIQQLVVTAQRRSEAIQSVPVAVSAFSADTLKAQRLDGGQNLVLSVPNVNYSRSNFGGYNFQIRGIGTKTVSPSGDAGVSINENALPLGVNHFGDTDFYDVERVEVLRGPQGTLYGRSATGGAVNIITAKPNFDPGGSLTYEYGNYNSNKVTGFVNAPFSDTLSLRLAGFYLKRDGFGENSVTGDKIDGRDLYSGRATLLWKPNERFHASLMFEHYEEKDSRNRVGKQLCIKDPGPTSVGGVPTNASNQGLLSQGCQAGSLYQNSAYGTLNSAATLAGLLTNAIGLTSGDVLAGHALQSHNLHDIESAIDPIYEAKQNLAELDLSWDITDHLTLESITGYNGTRGYTDEDYNRVTTSSAFSTTNPFFPGGVVPDAQVGATNRLRDFDYTDDKGIEKTEEIRLTSSFSGPLNFSLGGIYIDSNTSSDYDVFSNGLTAYSIENNDLGGFLQNGTVYVDPSNPPTGAGHNYYDARFRGTLKSSAGFGEIYYQVNDELKITGGVRYTDDRKTNVYYPIELLAYGLYPTSATNPTLVANPTYNGGAGFATSGLSTETADFTATTGRINIDWTPHFSFTNKTLIYGTYSRGYQGGGFNTPCANASSVATIQSSCGYSDEFQPVYVDAFEIGTKNVLMNGSLILNGDVFYYKENGYQISQIVNKSSVNTNINANLYGVEFEGVWEPVHHLTFNSNIGYLHTEITSGSVIDQMNITQGDPALTLVKGADGSNCAVNTDGLARFLAVNEGLGGLNVAGVTGSSTAILGICPYPGNSGVGATPTTQTLLDQAFGITPSAGVPVNLKGKELPNSPDFTVSLGVQYVYDLPNSWRATLRGDYYWQDSSYARVFNTVQDQLKSYDVVNATLTFNQPDLGLNVQLYVKNAFNSQPITDTYLTDASSGLFENTFTLDPRTFGLSVTKRF